jgi:hypothetical protein
MIGMQKEKISVIDLANQLGKRKQTIFKVITRLRITPVRMSGLANRGQKISYVTSEQARLIAETLANKPRGIEDAESLSNVPVLDFEEGYFYLVKCEPKFDPGRFKVGFASNVSERMRHLKVSAPYSELQRTWPCRRLWEKTAIECVTDGCERLGTVGTEVFRTDSMEPVLAKCQEFFSLMPKLPAKSGSSS